MRRRTAKLELTLLLAAAAALGCGPPQQRRCVDGEGRGADDWSCEHPGAAEWTASNGADGGAAAPVPAGGGYHWIYVSRPWYGWGWRSGWGSGGFSPGGEAGVARGGFGSTGVAHAAAAGHGSGA